MPADSQSSAPHVEQLVMSCQPFTEKEAKAATSGSFKVRERPDEFFVIHSSFISMLNVWLSCKEIKARFPLNSKVKIDWPGYAHDGVNGIVQGYHFYGQNRTYLLEVEMVFFTIGGRISVSIPWNRLKRV